MQTLTERQIFEEHIEEIKNLKFSFDTIFNTVEENNIYTKKFLIKN